MDPRLLELWEQGDPVSAADWLWNKLCQPREDVDSGGVLETLYGGAADGLLARVPGSRAGRFAAQVPGVATEGGVAQVVWYAFLACLEEMDLHVSGGLCHLEPLSDDDAPWGHRGNLTGRRIKAERNPPGPEDGVEELFFQCMMRFMDPVGLTRWAEGDSTQAEDWLWNEFCQQKDDEDSKGVLDTISGDEAAGLLDRVPLSQAGRFARGVPGVETEDDVPRAVRQAFYTCLEEMDWRASGGKCHLEELPPEDAPSHHEGRLTGHRFRAERRRLGPDDHVQGLFYTCMKRRIRDQYRTPSSRPTGCDRQWPRARAWVESEPAIWLYIACLWQHYYSVGMHFTCLGLGLCEEEALGVVDFAFVAGVEEFALRVTEETFFCNGEPDAAAFEGTYTGLQHTVGERLARLGSRSEDFWEAHLRRQLRIEGESRRLASLDADALGLLDGFVSQMFEAPSTTAWERKKKDAKRIKLWRYIRLLWDRFRDVGKALARDLGVKEADAERVFGFAFVAAIEELALRYSRETFFCAPRTEGDPKRRGQAATRGFTGAYTGLAWTTQTPISEESRRDAQIFWKVHLEPQILEEVKWSTFETLNREERYALDQVLRRIRASDSPRGRVGDTEGPGPPSPVLAWRDSLHGLVDRACASRDRCRALLLWTAVYMLLKVTELSDAHPVDVALPDRPLPWTDLVTYVGILTLDHGRRADLEVLDTEGLGDIEAVAARVEEGENAWAELLNLLQEAKRRRDVEGRTKGKFAVQARDLAKRIAEILSKECGGMPKRFVAALDDIPRDADLQPDFDGAEWRAFLQHRMSLKRPALDWAIKRCREATGSS